MTSTSPSLRCAGRPPTGASHSSFRALPTELGLPDYWDSHYDPLWRAIQDADLPVCLHIGLKLSMEDLARRDPTPQRAIFTSMVPMSTAEALGMWILTGILSNGIPT